MNTVKVDVISIKGDEAERGVVVNGYLVAVMPSDREETIMEAGAFFDGLSEAIPFTVFTVDVWPVPVDVEELGLDPDGWNWDEVLANLYPRR